MQVSFNKPADYQSVYRGQTDRSIETTDKNPESTAVTLNEIKHFLKKKQNSWVFVFLFEKLSVLWR